MAVVTRIDARSKRNNSLQICDANGVILCSIEAVKNTNVGTSDETLRNEVTIRIHTADDVQIVKGNGAVLRKK
ncbi:hypothetical protein HOT32_gp48 [Erwinia phage Faunus]|uniref:Uncharacterized protein n=1 Tax=Erwinia phage Faunus TaxID=2182346 RepID=A0A2U8UWJ7_9CAUD|nr:hypothetical protein HOT32_gp48 [Erwinia phage Faunus]AWN08631.1 hypothetical protein [Erwinia phage Faunus]